MAREWNLYQPGDHHGVCAVCAEPFVWSDRGNRRYCDAHITRKHVPKPTKQTTCKKCGQEFTQISMGRGQGRRHLCLSCREKSDARISIERTKTMLLKELQSKSSAISMFETTLEMTAVPVDMYDDPYLHVMNETLSETLEIIHALNSSDVLYGRSVTECPHQQPFNLERLEIMIEKKRGSRTVSEMVEAMRYDPQFHKTA